MIVYPNAKINLGLNVIEKRADGFHNIESVFYPIGLCDILEVKPSDTFQYSQSGIEIEGNIENNLVVKAYRLMEREHSISAVKVHLHKQIPFGAGLGGGSADAAFMLKALNELFQLNVDENLLIDYAEELGSDCPFFIINKPCLAEGKGEILNRLDIDITNYKLVLIKPEIAVPTAVAYSNIMPSQPKDKLETSIKENIGNWKGIINNDFELSVFKQFPEIKNIKNKLYNKGALYASMSGSGSTVFGIFEAIPQNLKEEFKDCFYWSENPS